MSHARRPAAFAVMATAAWLGALASFAAQDSPRRSVPPLPPRYELRGEDGLVRAYEFILEARFDQVEAELGRACGPAPPEACHVLEATAIWWRIQLDPESHALDPAFSAAVERAISTTEAWTERAPDDPEAWFYLGGAYGVRVQWRVLRHEKIAAARDGKRIKQALERAIELEPGLDDAYFGLGLYKYYADVAPAAARILRFLLLLPGGDREEGLREMLRARSRGRLLQGEADYQLHVIYLWYERQTRRAIELLYGLQARYPGNPLFLAQIAEVQDAYEHDLTASLETWRTLLAAAREQRANHATLAEVQARLGAARMLERVQLTDHALEHLTAAIALKPQAPYSSLAVAYLRLGEAQDRLGARAPAQTADRTAIAAVPPRDPYDVREQATARIRRAPDTRHAEAYRLSLEGWRRFERNDLAAAGAALDRAVALDHDEPVARYRLGRVLQARRRDPAALEQFEHAIRHATRCPAPVLGNAYLEAARLYERLGRRDDALSAYRVAAALFGASSETHAAAARALTRLASAR
jgi:predicted negative regulator of RcsB-dependent stress response